MSKFDDFMKLMNQYMSYHGFSFEICWDMRLTSYSGESKVPLVDSDVRVMDMDVLYAMKEKNIEYPPFDYGNPIQFFRTHVRYILVFRGALNPHHAMRLKNHRLKHEHYLPEFMKRLEGYIYKEAYAVTEDVFEHTFLRDFAF